MKNTTKDILNLTKTKSVLTKFFDSVDNVDRKLYGKRMPLFLWGCVLVLIISPILDELFGVSDDRITHFTTTIFFFFLLTLVLAFAGSWRDDTGNWSFPRAKSRLTIYFQILKDNFETTRTTSKDENLFKFGKFLFFGGIAWKALQNISVFIRKPIEGLFDFYWEILRKFEKITNHYYWIPLVLGVSIIIFLYNKNPQILVRIKKDLRNLFGWNQYAQTKYSSEIIKMEMNNRDELVINAKTEIQINSVIANSKSVLFNDFAIALQNWSPNTANYEWQYQDRLYRHLRKYLPEASIVLEYPIGSKANGNKGRADIVVNDTILIEMKRDSSAGAIQRAKGQISQYSEIWKDKGPVILLLCNYDYEHAKLSFGTHMTDLYNLDRPVITIVAKTKQLK
jgi:hypothetical protein